jgi:STAS-like domain of unknown function (DUF4325)
MTKTIKLNETFGEHCSNGDKAVKFLVDKVKPILDSGEDILFDLTDIKRMNSSFANAMFGNLFAEYENERFKICNLKDDLRVFLIAAFEHGLKVRLELKKNKKHKSIWEKLKSPFALF